MGMAPRPEHQRAQVGRSPYARKYLDTPGHPSRTPVRKSVNLHATYASDSRKYIDMHMIMWSWSLDIPLSSYPIPLSLLSFCPSVPPSLSLL